MASGGPAPRGGVAACPFAFARRGGDAGRAPAGRQCRPSAAAAAASARQPCAFPNAHGGAPGACAGRRGGGGGGGGENGWVAARVARRRGLPGPSRVHPGPPPFPTLPPPLNHAPRVPLIQSPPSAARQPLQTPSRRFPRPSRKSFPLRARHRARHHTAPPAPQTGRDATRDALARRGRGHAPRRRGGAAPTAARRRPPPGPPRWPRRAARRCARAHAGRARRPRHVLLPVRADAPRHGLHRRSRRRVRQDRDVRQPAGAGVGAPGGGARQRARASIATHAAHACGAATTRLRSPSHP
jgi:hypothetical protein